MRVAGTLVETGVVVVETGVVVVESRTGQVVDKLGELGGLEAGIKRLVVAALHRSHSDTLGDNVAEPGAGSRDRMTEGGLE